MIFIESAGVSEGCVYTGPFDHCQHLSLRSDKPYAKNQRAESDAILLVQSNVSPHMYAHTLSRLPTGTTNTFLT